MLATVRVLHDRGIFIVFGTDTGGSFTYHRELELYQRAGMTPPEIIKTLSDATNDALANPVVNERFSQLGVEPMPLTPAGFAKHIAEEAQKWTEVIRAQGIEVN